MDGKDKGVVTQKMI